MSVNRRIRPLLLTAVIVVPLLLAVAPAQAPSHEDAPLIEIDRLQWNPSDSAFVVSMSAKRGLIQAGGHADFTISVQIEIRDPAGGLIADLAPVDVPILPADKNRTRGFGFIAMQDAQIAWDRLGGTFEGTVDLTVTAQAQNGKGKDVGGSVVASEPGFGIVRGG